MEGSLQVRHQCSCALVSFLIAFIRSSKAKISYISVPSLHIYGKVTNTQNGHRPDGLIAQLVEHRTGIAEVSDSNPVQVNIYLCF